MYSEFNHLRSVERESHPSGEIICVICVFLHLWNLCHED